MPENHTSPKSSTSLKHEMVRQDIDQKWKRTTMTPTGIKIIRIQPSLNYDSLKKYQYRPDVPTSMTSTPTKHSPVPPPRGSPSQARNNNRALTATSIRSSGTQPSASGASRPGEVVERPPAPEDRPGSSRGRHTAAYNCRSSSCQPTRMYMKDDLRRRAKLNRPASHVHSCSSSQVEDNPTIKTPRSPRRFDGSVVTLPRFVEGNEFLTHRDLSMGQKQYIWGIARIYSMGNLMQLKQRQYQGLLDYDFNRRIQNKELKEHERMKEWREYLRYSKFIKNYEQRIPRAGKEKNTSASPCEEVSHIHRHVVKGWTTNPHSDEAFRPAVSRLGTRSQRDEEEREEVQRLPTDCQRLPTDQSGEHGEEEETSESISGHYRVVVVNTPKSGEDASERDDKASLAKDKQSCDEQQQQETQQTQEINEVSDVQPTSNTAEELSEGEESNYL